jgi:hypothetical protein
VKLLTTRINSYQGCCLQPNKTRTIVSLYPTTTRAPTPPRAVVSTTLCLTPPRTWTASLPSSTSGRHPTRAAGLCDHAVVVPRAERHEHGQGTPGPRRWANCRRGRSKQGRHTGTRSNLKLVLCFKFCKNSLKFYAQTMRGPSGFAFEGSCRGSAEK